MNNKIESFMLELAELTKKHKVYIDYNSAMANPVILRKYDNIISKNSNYSIDTYSENLAMCLTWHNYSDEY